MKRLGLVLLAAAGVLHAAPIYQCAFNAGGYTVAGCYSTTAFVNTNDTLDWGNQNGIVHDGTGSGYGAAMSNSFSVGDSNQTPWTTWSENGSVQVGLGILPGQSNLASPVFDRVDNAGYVEASSGSYVFPTTVPGLNVYAGRFSSPPNEGTQYNQQTSYTSANLAGYIGEHLVRLHGSTNSGILITFSQPVYSVGLRVSAMGSATITAGGNTATGQDLKILAYNVTNPTSDTLPYLSYELLDTSGWGQCQGLNMRTPNNASGHPTPCNDAPFIGIDSTSPLFTTTPLINLPNNPWISSVFIQSTDNIGVLLDELFIQDVDPSATPEPGVFLLIGSGLLVIGMRARSRRSNR